MMLRRERALLAPLEESCGVKVAVAGRRNPEILQTGTELVETVRIPNQVFYASSLSNVAQGKRSVRAITPRLDKEPEQVAQYRP